MSDYVIHVVCFLTAFVLMGAAHTLLVRRAVVHERKECAGLALTYWKNVHNSGGERAAELIEDAIKRKGVCDATSHLLAAIEADYASLQKDIRGEMADGLSREVPL